MTQNVKKRRRSSTAGAFCAFLLTVSAVFWGAAGCSSDECTAEDCRTCDDSGCAENQRCVQNECRNACAVNADCEGAQICSGYEFHVGDQGNYCVVLPGTAQGDETRFAPCDNDSDCDEAHGFSCIEGLCNYECRTHADCVAVGHCGPTVVDGVTKNYCVRDATPPAPGKLYTSCPSGDECTAASLCIGAGPGDLDAYCTIDCASDDDCALGYFCGAVTRSPCEDACDVPGRPLDPRCAPLDQIGTGKPFQCREAGGAERRVCRQRDFCATCETDADCLGAANQVCARDEGGEKICTRLCEPGTRSCPWGNASRCAVFDEDLGVPTCSHRFGACHGNGETCEPCRDDADCPGGVCAASGFTGERWCINLGTTCECQNGVSASGTCIDGGCPDSPSGLPVQCVGASSSDLFNLCYAANSASDSVLGSSPQTGCWGPP